MSAAPSFSTSPCAPLPASGSAPASTASCLWVPQPPPPSSFLSSSSSSSSTSPSPSLPSSETSASTAASLKQAHSQPQTGQSEDQHMGVEVAPSSTANPKPARRFLPQPIEQSTRSSRRRGDQAEIKESTGAAQQPEPGSAQLEESRQREAAVVAPRRFAVQPVETSVRSSRRKFVPEPVETTARSNRSSKNKGEQVSNTTTTTNTTNTNTTTNTTNTTTCPDPNNQEGAKPPTRRRFAPVAIESSTRSSKDKRADSECRQRKRRKDGDDEEAVRAADTDQGHASTTSASGQASPRGHRKFSPELLETAKGSYRHSTILLSPRHTLIQSAAATRTITTIPENDGPTPAATGESRFSAAALAKRHRELHRRHSFQVPDLPAIESDSGDDSEAPSITNSRSSAESETAKPLTDPYQCNRAAKKANKWSIQNDPGGSYVNYVIEPAAKTAPDKELEEQAMAAYINERPHERIAHYGFDEDEDPVAAAAVASGSPIRIGRLSGEHGVDVRTFRRSSQDEHDWEMQNMRNHHMKLEQMKREFKQDVAGASRFSAAALLTRHHQQDRERERKKKEEAIGILADDDADFIKMKKAASPPMLGLDLVFPFTISPKMTRCDTDQVPRPRTYDSDDDEDDDGAGEGADTGVWTNSKCGGKVKVEPPQTDGLWMGLCHSNPNDGLPSRQATSIRSGIQTPAALEIPNPFDSVATSGRRPGHLSPGCRIGPKLWNAATYSKPQQPQPGNLIDDHHFTSSIDSKLLLEKQIDEQFPDSFITQIYNYLSLGYPCLAWAFDEELSKISRIPVEELRKDDGLVDARGYVGVPEGTSDWHVNGLAYGEIKTTCRRWEALRLYVREWARQSPSFRESSHEDCGLTVSPITKRANGWGGNVAVRKGSWGH